MNEIKDNPALYLRCHPLLRESSLKKKKKYIDFLSYYTALDSTPSRFSLSLMSLYKKVLIGDEYYSPCPTPSIAGLFKYRFILYMDVWFMNAYGDSEKAEYLLRELENKAHLAKPFQKKMRQLFERLYITENGISFPKIEEFISLWKKNETFSQQAPFRTVFTANMSAGKSTLINALVGKKINRSQNLACTAKLHYIKSKPYEDGFSSEDDNILNLDADLETLMTDDDGNSSDVITVNTYFRLLTSQIGPLTFLDTPGVNSSVDQRHKTITDVEMSKGNFDVLVYVINANSVATDDENVYMRQLQETVSDTPIVFAINKLDSFRSGEDDIATTVAKIKEDIDKLGFRDAIVCPVSAYAGFLAKRALFDNDLDEDETDELRTYRRLFQKEGHNLSCFYPESVRNTCTKMLEVEKNESKGKNLQLLSDCGILPLEIILAEKNKEAHI